jgi:hypothetical protein
MGSTVLLDDDVVRVYTLKEIDDQLSILADLLTSAKKLNKDKVLKQVDHWLDVRLDLRTLSGT